jgi:8-oxo-dGTP pyrophosphatase MutT (NUDIX family)
MQLAIELDWRLRERRSGRRRAGNWQTSGGVVVDVRTGKLLVVLNRREGWTWPKGVIDAGEGPIFAALREIKEEAGVLAEPVGRIAMLESKRALRHYFLLWKIRDGMPTSGETCATRWVTFAEAKRLLTRPRDHRVLRAARGKLEELDEEA